MIICHHIDNDGYCAAAIILNECRNIYDNNEVELIPHNYGVPYDINKDREYTPHEKVYFVDLSIDKETMDAIKFFVDMGCDVVHIDHHQSTLDTLSKLDAVDGSYIDSITTFYDVNHSGCMLSWIYACMNDEQRKNPSKVNYSFMPRMSHVMFDGASKYRIPDAVRFVDDHDIWKHEFNETRAFNLGIGSDDSINKPDSDFWNKLLYTSNGVILNMYIDKGRVIQAYQNNQNKLLMESAFEFDMIGVKLLCVNTKFGNSDLFGDKINEYDAVCKYYFDGPNNIWRYTFYSADDGIDVTQALSDFGVAGHPHAAGLQTDFCIFG